MPRTLPERSGVLTDRVRGTDSQPKKTNKMRKRDNIIRIWAIAVLYIVIALVYVGRLLYLQVSGQDYYSMSTPSRTYSRTVKIQAQRGEIFDRNGNPLVYNNYSHNIALDYASLPADDKASSDIMISLVDAARILGMSDCIVEPKESLVVTAEPGVGLSYSMSDSFLDSSRGRKYTRLIGELNVKDGASLEEQAEALLLHYGIAEWDDNDELSYRYTYESCAFLLELRLDMDLSGFSSVSPYVLIEGANLELLTIAEETCPRGILIQVSAERVYNYPGYASHILGRVGKIPGAKLEYYTELGYPMDAVVGLEGVEQAFEEYLRGTDGELKITEDSYGNILSTEVTKEPSPGHDVYLTLDIEMQMVAEKALAENIFKIREEAKWSGPLSGEDASAGAMTVLDVDTGEILAICSYPTYNLATWNEDYAVISTAEPGPLFNRALYGTYAPGSTFKVGVSVAALEEKIIEKNTYINAQGMYMYYADSGYTPRCWLYLMTGQSHGPINVVEAIQESCNYFFYDVGRRLTIEKMNEYCKHFGLGEPTGIELPEKTGILAGPDYRADNGLNQWSPGDTLQAAIGQSDNLFTPLQLSTYLSTILNGGTRYNAHLLYQVRSYGGERILHQNQPTVASEIEIADDILDTVREGMRGVMDNGSAASVFSGYAIPVGGKTGTAQVSDTKSDNGVMTAFAPFDDPEIVISCIIEQGSGGTEAGYSVRDVFDYYFRDEIAALAAAEAEEEETWYGDWDDSGDYNEWGG